jgi:diaminopimelate epimerase
MRENPWSGSSMSSSTWRALGNTYRVVDGESALDPRRARELAVGTDGVVEVVSEGAGRVEILVWNPDGSRAELSGNGARIAAAWHAVRSGTSEVEVETRDRVVSSRLLASGAIEQDLGQVVVGERETIEGVTFVPVDVGNPHAVVLGDPNEIERLGPMLEAHQRFPRRTNVQVARVERAGEVTARVWERGVGETASSGTSAVAIAAATHGTGEVLVHFPGGDLLVRLVGGRATLVGRAERVS